MGGGRTIQAYRWCQIAVAFRIADSSAISDVSPGGGVWLRGFVLAPWPSHTSWKKRGREWIRGGGGCAVLL